MKTQFNLLVLLLAVAAGSAFAQEKATNSFGISWGVGNVKRQDLSFSSQIHQQSSATNLVLNYKRSGKFEQQVIVRYGQYQPIVGEVFSFDSYFNTKEWSSQAHIFTMIDLNYSLGKRVLQKDKLGLIVGGRLRNRIQPSDYVFGDAGSFGYYASFGLDLWLKAKYDLKERQYLEANLQVPFLSLNTRSPYKSQDDQYFLDNYKHNDVDSFINFLKRGEIESWGKSQIVDFDLSYNYELTEKLTVGASYWFSLNKSHRPLSMTTIENVFYISGQLTF